MATVLYAVATGSPNVSDQMVAAGERKAIKDHISSAVRQIHRLSIK
jgi:hypothetical protein